MRNAQNREIFRQNADVRVFHIEEPGTSLLPAAQDPACHVHLLSRFRRWRLLRPGATLTDLFYDDQIAAALARLLQTFQPHIVVMEEPWLYGYFPVIRKHACRVIVDLHNVETYVYAAIARRTDPWCAEGIRARKMLHAARIAERECVLQADDLWVCSEEDADRIAALFPQASSVSIVPNGVDLSYYRDVKASALPMARTMILCGNFYYQPNSHAAHVAMYDILPRVRRDFSDAKLLIVGQRPPMAIRRMAADHAVEVTGAVPDVRPYISRASVAIMPIITGGGTRFKILESMAAGCPVVASAKAAEGLLVRDGEHLLIAEHADGFARAIRRLWTDRLYGAVVAQAACAQIKLLYSYPAVTKSVLAALRSGHPA